MTSMIIWFYPAQHNIFYKKIRLKLYIFSDLTKIKRSALYLLTVVKHCVNMQPK